MRTITLLLAGIAMGWIASDIEWTRDAVGQDAAIGVEPIIAAEATAPPTATTTAVSAPADGAERSIRRQRDGVLRRRGILPSRETPPAAANEPSEAPAFAPALDTPASAEAMPAVIPDSELIPPLSNLNAPHGPALLPASDEVTSVGRYQLSAFNTSSNYGYYVVDTVTGRVWYGLQGSAPRLVVGALPDR